MSKFKVGDRVIGNKEASEQYGITTEGYKGVVTKVYSNDNILLDGAYDVSPKYFDLIGAEPERNEIYITTKGNRTIAIQKQNGKVINRAEAVCAPFDMFDFNTGAQLAYDRLMKPETQCKTPTEDKPEPKYKVGDKVKVIKNALSSNSAKESYVGNVYEIKNAQGTDHVHGTKYGIGEMCVVYEDEIEPYTEPAPEPIKLYCVKDHPDIVTKGRVYELPNFLSDYRAKEGIKASHYDDFSDFSKCNPLIASCLVPLVARLAKVGEWVLMTSDSVCGTEKGEICEVVEINDASPDSKPYLRTKEKTIFGYPSIEPCTLAKHNDYLVLDGYQPEPEYYSGKVICVEWYGECYTPGKIYNVVDGYMKNNLGINASTRFKTLDDVLNYSGKFIELVEDCVMPNFESGVASYIDGVATIRVHFPVDGRGNAAINCKQCPYLSSNERMCQLNKQPVAYPNQYVGDCCPLEKEA